MNIPLTPSLYQDTTLKKIDVHLFELEHVVIQEYRRLLAEARKGLDELLRFPTQLAASFQEILAKLQRALEGTGDRVNLRIVTDQQEELRIRMLVLSHLLERDIPFAYLERAFHPAAHSAIFAHRGEGVGRSAYSASGTTVALPRGDTPPRSMFTRIFRREAQTSLQKRNPMPDAGASGVRESVRTWFHNLPEYLRFLFLLHHFMEKDELRLLKPTQRAPSLGAEYGLRCGVALFEGEDGGEYHWGTRAERRRAGRPADDQLARSLQEKLMQQDYLVGVRSQFQENRLGVGERGVPVAERPPRRAHAGVAHGPDDLYRKLQHLATPTGVRASFEEPEQAKPAADAPPWLMIDYTP